MSEWIDVNDRLPKESGQTPLLIVYQPARNRRKVTTAAFGGGEWHFLVPRFGTSVTGRVTHWMPFPRPPK